MSRPAFETADLAAALPRLRVRTRAASVLAEVAATCTVLVVWAFAPDTGRITIPWLVDPLFHGTSVAMMTSRAHLDPMLDVGFRVALDDLGCGRSSFRSLPARLAHFLDIEGWVVRALVADQRTVRLSRPSSPRPGCSVRGGRLGAGP